MPFSPWTMPFPMSIHVAGGLPLRSWNLCYGSGAGDAAELLPEKEGKAAAAFPSVDTTPAAEALPPSGQQNTLDLKPSRTRCQSARFKHTDGLQHHRSMSGGWFIHAWGQPVPKLGFNTSDDGEGRLAGSPTGCTSTLFRRRLGTVSWEPKRWALSRRDWKKRF
uniref:Uncharacterized protein n=1 Tax=Myotis myotis TaxID=51298 RepID=A0A7J8ANH5_MYOMY|nr:hypothetical protein mMyoMyo1_008108 [Myotis myotis]